ncbi:DEAD/DEAH box helicase [Streptococcus moroccensis]|uniref:SNF2 family DNA or RNA helicase n=1 Tax=Streptococcus moroccensis TaxID=1451356 RepID=A0ABT9YR29_9STRE|nr:DEAD/DEAH box helicase [Streptococcus moroccensis]MDQ0222225.1 SNF2 family DNA or RNA helicase [Streptococcus moroccensis]
MSRLMPGYVRNQGIALYEAQVLNDMTIQDETIVADIDGHHLIFSFEDSLIQCDCELFGKKGFCEHLAAMEYYLKNDETGQELTEKVQSSSEQLQEEARQKSVGSDFLDSLPLGGETNQTLYRLEAEGQYSLLDRQLVWTLKILRMPDTRSYIIRDIKAFLKTLNDGKDYQIGKNYFEPIHLEQFDQASQDLLLFLNRLLPEAVDFDTSFYLPNFGRHLRLSEGFFEEGLKLLQGLSDFQLILDEQTYRQVTVTALTGEAPLFSFQVVVEQTLIDLTMHECSYQAFFQEHYLFKEGVFYRLTSRQKSLLKALRKIPLSPEGQRVLQVDIEDKDRLALLLLDLDKMGTVKAPKNFKIHDFRAYFEFTRLANDTIRLEMALDFDKIWVPDQAMLESLPFTVHYQHLAAIHDLMQSHGFQPGFTSEKPLVLSQDFYDFYTRTLPAFEEFGEVVLSETVTETFSPSQARLHLDLTGDFLDVAFDFQDVKKEEISAAYEALQSEQSFYVTESGKMIIFDEETNRVNQTLQDLRAQLLPNGALKMTTLSALQLAQQFEGEDSIHLSGAFQGLMDHLRFPERFELQPFKLNATLRDYQLLGVKWLSMLAHYGLGGILADDMGLGKTLQTIAFLSHSLKAEQKALILAPSSLIYNWQDEFQKFAPHIDVVVSYGSKAQRMELLTGDHQITVTSYASFRQDFEAFQEKQFDVLILDEAQVMKNDQTKIAHHLRQFEAKSCFALSGTPIENHLTEIWSIFQIVMPDLLPAKRAFNKLTAKEVARMIQPFVLRRRKEEVLTELPDLQEINQINELTDDQKAIYLAQIQQLRDSLSDASDSEINSKKIEILSAITRLRQICNTPKLFMPDYQGDSGKLESLRQLLLQIQEGNHRVLIFSQFRGMLELIQEELDNLNMTSYTITGSTKSDERQDITRAFNAGSRDAVLISLKAGGVGINLTGADTVILVDLWWNPAVEDQAVARAYRMGQQKNVEFYRLITRGTIEEKIQALQDNKRQLITTVLDGQDTRGSLSAEDIREILSLPIR